MEAVFKAIDRVTAPVTRMQNRIGKMTRTVGRNLDNLNRRMDKFGRRAKQGALAVGIAGAIATGVMADVVRTGAEFEQTLIVAASKFPGQIRRSTDAFQVLEDAVRSVGRETEFTSSQGAQALKYLAQAGLSAEAAVSLLPRVVELATAAQIGLDEAANMATKSLGAFGLRTEDVAQQEKNLIRVMGVLSAVADTSGSDVSEFFEAISEGAKVLEQAGGSVETFGAMTGILANSSQMAGKAGTALRNVILRLTAPVPEAERALHKLKVKIEDVDGNVRDMPDIFEDLGKALSKFGQRQRQAILKTIFQNRSITAANILLEAGADKMRSYSGELESVGDYTKRLANIVRDSLAVELKETNSAVESVKLSIFKLVREPLSGLINKTTEWVRANEELIAQNVAGFILKIFDNLDKIAEIAPKIGIAAAAVMGLIVTLKTLALVLTVLNLLMIPLTGGLSLILAGITLIIAGVGILAVKFHKFIQSYGGYKQVLANVASFFKETWGSIADWAAKLWDGIVEKFHAAMAKITGGIDKVKGLASDVGGFFGIGGDDEGPAAAGAAGPQVVSPEQRAARMVEERNFTSRSELTIRDETGRTEVTRGSLAPGVVLQPTGGY